MATNKFGLITKYAQKALDQVLIEDSKTSILENGSKFIKFDFTNAHTVRIGTLKTDGLANYSRAGHAGFTGTGTGFDGSGHNDGYQVGGAELVWKEYNIAFDRAISIRVDEMDDEEAAGLIIANIVPTLMEQHIVNEVDECRFARMGEKCYASLGNKIVETIDTTKGSEHEITHSWNKAFEFLKEHGVPEDEQVIFASPAVNTAILNTPEIYKTLTQVDYRGDVSFAMRAYMGRPIIIVPSDRFYDKVVTTKNGFMPTEDAKLFNYIVCSKRAGNPVAKLNKIKIFGPEVIQEYDGYKVNAHILHDFIIPDEKICAFFCSVSEVSATSKANSLSIAMREGVNQNGYVVDNAISTPGGIMGNLVFTATAVKLGATPTSPKNITLGVEVVDATNTKGYFAIVGADGKAKAVSAQLTLTKKA